jgi:hypothetical protein
MMSYKRLTGQVEIRGQPVALHLAVEMLKEAAEALPQKISHVLCLAVKSGSRHFLNLLQTNTSGQTCIKNSSFTLRGGNFHT